MSLAARKAGSLPREEVLQIKYFSRQNTPGGRALLWQAYAPQQLAETRVRTKIVHLRIYFNKKDQVI